jgi:hypothetical protein
MKYIGEKALSYILLSAPGGGVAYFLENIDR